MHIHMVLQHSPNEVLLFSTSLPALLNMHNINQHIAQVLKVHNKFTSLYYPRQLKDNNTLNHSKQK